MKLKITLIFIFGIISFIAFGDQKIIITDSLKIKNITSKIDYIIEKDKKYSIDHMLKKSLKWNRNKKNNINFGFSTSPYWFRFSLNNRSNYARNLLFEIDKASLDSIIFYIWQENGTFKKLISGDHLSIIKRDTLNSRNFVFPLKIESGNTICYFRIKSSGAINFKGSLLTYESLYEKNNLEMAILWIIIGCLLVIAIYNLFVYLTLFEETYLYFFIHIVFITLIVMSSYGLDTMYFKIQSIWLIDSGKLLYYTLAIFSGTLFLRSFLETKINYPTIDKFIFVTIIIPQPILIILAFILRFDQVISLVLISVLIYALFFLFLSFYAAIKKNKAAWFIIVGYSFLLFATMNNILINLNVLSSYPMNRFLFAIGSGWLMIFTSLGLTARMHGLKNELDLEKQFSENIIQGMPGIFYVYDENFRLSKWNRNFEINSGYSNKELSLMTISDWFNENDLKEIMKSIKEMDLFGEASIETNLLMKDGTSVPYFLNGVNISRDGKEYLVGLGLDITARKSAENALRESEERYRSIVENIQEGLLIVGDNYKFEYINKKLCEIFGYSFEELIGNDFRNYLDKDSIKIISKHYLLQQKDREKSPQIELTIIRKNYEKRIVRITTTTYYDIKGIIKVIGLVLDLTEQKRSEEQLRQSQKMETVGNLAGGLAHDFNNVLGGITTPLSLITYKLNQKKKLPKEKLQEYIDLMMLSSERAINMVKQLLSLSRKQDLSFDDIDLNDSIKQIMKLCESTFDKSIKLIPVYYKEPVMVRADINQIEQVILNFCINASHAMTIMRNKNEQWGGELIVSIDSIFADKFFCKIHPEAKEEYYWMISIKDSGVGIDKETISKIFDPFFTTKDKDIGTGLGLSMVYNIIKQHHGFIDVYSEVGDGSTFNIYFPHLVEEDDDTKKEVEEEKIIKGEGLILVVDDEEIMRTVAKDILEECGYDVLVANNGKEGLESFEKHNNEIKAVMLDMVMPEMSGKEAFIKIKEIEPNVSVLLTSGFRKDQRVEDALSLGVKDFIQKPYTLEKLSEAVYRLLNQ